MLIDDLNYSISVWINALNQYDLPELCTKPSAESWSPGQLYIHLINDTNYYIGQIKICIANNDHAEETATPSAQTMFLNNSFPDERLIGDPSNNIIPQPLCKADLMKDLIELKKDLNDVAELILSTSFKGKTKHPGFGYFTANEWLQFADMHFRHHLKQKKRIDDFLKAANIL